jgi:hypothetical protein
MPEVCTDAQINALFVEMDTANTKKLTMEQITNYIKRVSVKNTRELQDEVLEEIAVKVKQSNSS